MTALNGHMKNIPPTLSFYYSSNPPFPSMFYLLPPKLYNIKYKPKSSIYMKDQTCRVLKSEDK